MSDYAIPYADLKGIENNLSTIYNNLEVLDNRVSGVSQNVQAVYSEVGTLAKEFHDYVARKDKADRLQLANTKLVQIRQEIEKNFGHYDIVRRSTTGILQADDLGIVKKDTISNATEDLMISVSGAVCLSTEGGITLEMERYFRSMPGAPEHLKAIRILEFNAEHPAYKAMAEAFAEDDKEKAAKIARILHAQALLIAGEKLDDPAAYSELVCSLI